MMNTDAELVTVNREIATWKASGIYPVSYQ